MHRHLLRLRGRLLSTSAAVSSPLLPPRLLLRRFTSSVSSLPPPHSLSPRPPRRLPPDPDDPSTLLRQDPISLCASLWIDSFRDPSTTASSLSPHLRRLELWVLAYQKTYADETGSYLPKSSISRPALESLLALRNAVLDGRFRWGARLDFFIRSPRDKTDPSSLSKRKLRVLLTSAQPPPFQDHIVQEVLLMILEPIYEARFSQKSFAFALAALPTPSYAPSVAASPATFGTSRATSAPFLTGSSLHLSSMRLFGMSGIRKSWTRSSRHSQRRSSPAAR